MSMNNESPAHALDISKLAGLVNNGGNTFCFLHEGKKIHYPLMSESGMASVSPAYYGFEIIETGGGCSAWQRFFSLDGKLVHMLLTDTTGCRHDLEAGESVLMGIYLGDEFAQEELACWEESAKGRAI